MNQRAIYIYGLLDSFVNENRNYEVYELYINKINPYYFDLLLYAGKNSLTMKENKDFDQISLGIARTKGMFIQELSVILKVCKKYDEGYAFYKYYKRKCYVDNCG